MAKSQLPPQPIGWPLLPLPDAQGQLNYPTLADSVRQSIQVILSTLPGEQLMHPEFGGGLARMLEQPNTLATRRQIHDLIADAIDRWDPRAIVDRIDVMELADRPTDVRVEIAYRLRRTGQQAQLGLTVKLGV
jgi:phage baseplate assembly protein W